MIVPLSAATLDDLPSGFARPRYDRAALAPGILHFGPGAFFRAHQAAYADALLGEDRRWAINAVALNTNRVANALRPQDGFYTLAVLGEETRLQVVGSLLNVLNGTDRDLIMQRLADRTTQLVTATVTEKGYCLAANGDLDLSHPAIREDLTHPSAPRGFIGWLVGGLRARREACAGPITVLSCDNLACNGPRLGRAVTAFAEQIDPDLARWIADNVRFPASMVDSITPATDDALRDRILAEGVADAWPVQREAFTQWVIQDDFAGERPAFDHVGAEFTRSVEAWEDTKLRILNGAHSTLAYLGVLLGIETVGDAMKEPELAGFVERLMREYIAPTLDPSSGIDHQGYISAVLARFRNPSVRHRLSQIAWDGSQKLPFRLLPTIRAARAMGRPIDQLLIPLAAWFRFVSLPRPPAPPLVDPITATLTSLGGNLDALVERSDVVSADLIADAPFRKGLAAAWAALSSPRAIRHALR